MTDDIFDRLEANMPPPWPSIPGHLAFTADQLRAELAATPAAELEQLIELAEKVHDGYLRERWGTEEKLEEDQLDALLFGGFGPGRVGGIGNAASGFGPVGGGFGPGGGGFGPGDSTGAAKSGRAGAGRGGMGAGGGGAMGVGGAGAGRAGASGMGGMAGVGSGAKGQGGGDKEYQARYLVESDPSEIFGTDEPTAPPVIGE